MTATPDLTRGPMGHVGALDGLRGLAVLAVVAHHLDHLPGGYLGVDAFFVLSGFLITGLLVDEVRRDPVEGIDLARFWARRVKRLLPALAVVLVTVLVVEALRSSPAIGAPGEPLATVLYVYNWYALVDGVDYWSALAEPSPLRHMWSLAIEEQFYLVWPIVVVAVVASVRRTAAPGSSWTGAAVRRIGVVAGVGALLSVGVAQLVHDPDNPLRVYYGTDARVAAILFGAVAATTVRIVALRARAERVLGAAALVVVPGLAVAWAALEGTSAVLYRGGLVACGLGVTVVVVAVVVAPRSVVARAMSWAPLRWCGLVSYGLYLWHWPIIVWLTPARTGLDGPALLITRLTVITALTLASYFLVEQPVRTSSIAKAPTLWVAGTAFAVLAAVTFATSNLITSPLEQPAAGTRSTIPIPPPRDLELPGAPTGSHAPTDAPTPSVGVAPDEDPDVALPNERRLIVLGDSGAWFLGEAIYDLGSADRVILPRGTVGCGIANVGGGVHTADGAFLADPPGCDEWPRWWGDDIDAFRPDDALVVLSWPGIGDRDINGIRSHPCDRAFDDFYAERVRLAIATAGQSGADVFVATAPYYVGSDGGAIEPERIDCLNTIMTSASTDTGATIVDLAGWICESHRCRVTHDGVALRPDGLHFSGGGGQLAARWVIDEIGRLSADGTS